MDEICIYHSEEAKYPTKGNRNPSVYYPEYLFGSENISKEENRAYEAVRGCLAGLGLDKENFGTAEWNPLGEYISKGDRVVIKPNLVMHKNENADVKENDLDCLITNPACIRAICDYCLIALKGTGKITIGDAPMQGCDFKRLLERTGLPEILDFYKGNKYENISIKDFREYGTEVNKHSVLVKRNYNDGGCTVVRLDDNSQHCSGKTNGLYQVSDYDIEDTIRYHNKTKHEYVIAEEVIKADVVINFCKPKTHRLAGFTGAMKNMVGITYNKACLPHRTKGSAEEGGDAYEHKNAFKRMADWALTCKIRQENEKHIFAATVLRYVYGVSLIIGNTVGKDKYFIGSWSGNDTIWRTVCDLNYIVKYADKNGIMQKTPQRRMLCFGDMIIAGEENGPASPRPKKIGLMMAGENPAAFDMALCKIMGFEYDNVPLTRNIAAGATKMTYTDPIIAFTENGKLMWQKPLKDTKFPAEWAFLPHEAWRK